MPFAHAVLLRELPDHGAALLVDVLVATFVADTAAYAGGRMFGRHRLAPALSPNKTLEGLAFGFVGGTLGVLVRRPLPGLAAGHRRAGDGRLRRRAGAGRRPVRVDDQARPRGSRTRARSSARTAACSTASTRSCSRSSPATTWRSRSSTDVASRTGLGRRRLADELEVGAARPSAGVAGRLDDHRRACGRPADHLPRARRGRSGPRRGARGGRRRCRAGRGSRWRAGGRCRPVIASARSTASESSSPAACAWQVSKQKPRSTPVVGVADRLPEPRQRVEAPRDGVVAAGGVLDAARGTSVSSISSERSQRPGPSAMSSSAWPPWTITAAAPTSEAASQVCWRILREP